MANINDLRSALELLQTIDGQYVETDVEVDPNAELSGVYRYVGTGGTVSRPTREGPAMVFNNVKGHPDARVTIGVLASRKRVGYLLGEKPENLGKLLNRAVSNPIPPVVVDASKAQCQEVVHYATEEGFDIRKLIPAPTNTEEDAGPSSPWACAMPLTQRQKSLTSPSTACACRARTRSPCTSSPAPAILAYSGRRRRPWASPCPSPSAWA